MFACLFAARDLLHRSILSRGWEAGLATAVLVLTFAGPVVAQQKSKLEVAPEPKSWVMGYFVVGLGITLGLVAVCRPGKRTTEFRRDGDA